MFEKSQRSADRYFTILFQSNTVHHPRLGFAISKQKVRRAVGRNRLRRLIRESFRQRVPDLPAVDLVVLARDAATAAPNKEIVASLDQHWARITSGAYQKMGQTTGQTTGNSGT